MAYETMTTPDGQEVQVLVISEDDRTRLDAIYEEHRLKSTKQKIDYWKERLNYTFYHARKGYTEEGHLKALERAALIEVM
jgi:hypothetical protein